MSKPDKTANSHAGKHDDEFESPFFVKWSNYYGAGWYWKNHGEWLPLRERMLAGPYNTSEEAFNAAKFQTQPATM